MNTEKVIILETARLKEIIIGKPDDMTAKRINNSLLSGNTITYASDWRKQFINDKPILDSNKDFVWNKSGNRCKHNRTLVTIHKDGTRTEEVLKTVWKSI
tara:strand:+ start:89 stop:388 length:300 start_codon:yes stop_codon:yes gene_type:complete